MSIRLTSKYATNARQFGKSEGGALTAFGLFLFVSVATIGAIAVDVSNLMAARTQLQVAADAAAHAALYYRELHDADEAKQKAIDVVNSGMPDTRYGEVLSLADIRFGTWDYDNDVFIVDDTSSAAVMVKTSRISDKDNSIASILAQFVGRSDWDVSAPAVFATFRPMCFTEGFVAGGIVDIQSNNGFSNGFCIHSNTYVSLNSGNTFEAGTVVSMPNVSDIDLPRSGYETNDGLRAALRSGVYRLRIIKRIDDLLEGLLLATNPDYIRSYILGSAVIALPSGNNAKLDETDFTKNRIHTLHCTGSRKLTITSGANPISDIILVTDCEIKFGANTVLENVVITTTHTGAKSMNSASGFQVGRDDDCAEGGDAQLVTKGSMSFLGAGLKMFNAQLLAEHDVTFTANADGIKGASVVAGGEISGTSNGQMAYCGTGMENNFEVDYFRLAR